MPVTSLLAVVLVLGACSGAAAPTRSPSAATPTAPAASAPATAAPDATPVASEGGAGGSVTSPGAAAELVLAEDPRFAGFGPQDPDMIGQCCWYEVTEAGDGWTVLVHAGWGDCPSGCINKHEWTYSVSRTGEVELTGETGDPVPAGELPAG